MRETRFLDWMGAPGSQMNIFFDVDYTILGMDNTLRPRTKETFQLLIDDGHLVYIWSGLGPRWEVVKQHKLEKFASGVYEKPMHDFHARLEELGVPVTPDFVIDDYPEVVSAFGGVWVPPYFFKRSGDEEMDRIYRIATEYVERGSSDDRQFRAKGSVVPLF